MAFPLFVNLTTLQFFFMSVCWFLVKILSSTVWSNKHDFFVCCPLVLLEISTGMITRWSVYVQKSSRLSMLLQGHSLTWPLPTLSTPTLYLTNYSRALAFKFIFPFKFSYQVILSFEARNWIFTVSFFLPGLSYLIKNFL